MRERRSSRLKRPRTPHCGTSRACRGFSSLRCRSALLTESAKGPKAADEGRTSFVRFAQEIRHYAARFVFDEASVRAYWRLLAASPRGRTFTRNSEGVPQALGDRVNGDVDGKAIQCSCLVKGLFDLRIRGRFRFGLVFRSALSAFCEDGKEVSRGLKELAGLGRRDTDEVQPRLYL